VNFPSPATPACKYLAEIPCLANLVLAVMCSLIGQKYLQKYPQANSRRAPPKRGERNDFFDKNNIKEAGHTSV
jgi:hypothetical protein